MSLVVRLVLLAFVAMLIAVIYVSPRYPDAKTTIRGALPKALKLLIGTVVLISAMQLIQLLFLP